MSSIYIIKTSKQNKTINNVKRKKNTTKRKYTTQTKPHDKLPTDPPHTRQQNKIKTKMGKTQNKPQNNKQNSNLIKFYIPECINPLSSIAFAVFSGSYI